MSLSFDQKKWLAVAGALGLSVLGSAAWDVVVKPIFQWLVRVLLSALTLGSASVQDGIYREASKGFHEAPSLMLLGFTLAVIAYSPFILLYELLSARKQLQKFVETSGTTLPRTKEQSEIVLKETSKEINRLMKPASLLTKSGFILSIPLFLSVGAVCIIILQDLQANEALLFFNQEIRICGPVLSEQQSKEFESRFARVKNKSDYIAVTQDLRNIAEKNGLPLPSYKP